VLAGFVNRGFALPAKLSSIGLIKIPKETTAVLDTIGTYLFFIIISIFAIWVIGTFVMNIKKLKGEEV
jgi:hypothetical protein